MPGRTDVVAEAIRVLANENYSDSCRIHDGLDEAQTKEYELAQSSYEIPTEFTRLRGWARRPDRGEMYGRKYIEKYKSELYLLYKQGSNAKDKKMGPSAMLDVLKRHHPGIYTLPSFAEVQSFVSQLFSKEKKNGKDGPLPDLDYDNAEHDTALSKEHKRVVVEIVESFGGGITPHCAFVKFVSKLQLSDPQPDDVKDKVKKLVAKTRTSIAFASTSPI